MTVEILEGGKINVALEGNDFSCIAIGVLCGVSAGPHDKRRKDCLAKKSTIRPSDKVER